MKSFILFLIILIIACWTFPHSDFMKKTRSGVKQEAFEPLNSSSLPPILKTYFANNHVKFEIYKIPNHVRDLLTLNSDFSSVYRNKSKISIIITEPKDKNSNFDLLHSTVKKSLSDYPNKFNLIYRYESNNIDYANPYDTDSARDLMEICKSFCLIDPQRETVLTFKKLTATEVESVEAIFQQYSEIVK